MEESKREIRLAIIGQGLAGSALALDCIKRKIDFHVFDTGLQFSAGFIATGLMNPFAGRQFALSWRWMEAFPFAKKTYRFAESLLQSELLIEMSILRLFSNIKEANSWPTKQLDYPDLLTDWDSSVLKMPNIEYGSGGMLTHQAATLRCDTYLSKFRSYLQAESALTEMEIGDNAIEEIRTTNTLQFRIENQNFTHIIYAGGYKDSFRPNFQQYGIVPCKGTILEGVVEGSSEWGAIPIKGTFAVPREHGKVKIGSTYSWTLEEGPEPNAKSHLAEKYTQMFKSEFKLENELWGWRPTTANRRPVSELVSENRYVLNGLGSKGTLLAPILASELITRLYR